MRVTPGRGQRGGGSVLTTLVTMAGLGAAASVLTACGEEVERPTGPRPPERLTQAVTGLAEAGTGHFVSRTTGSDGAVRTTLEGDYQLAPPAAQLSVVRADETGAQQGTVVVTVGPDAWSRDLPTAGDRSCWVHYNVTTLFASGLLVRNGDTYAPAPVAVVASGAGVYAVDADQVGGSSDLRPVLAVADLAVPSLLGLPATAGERVSATFTVDEGVLAGWKVFVRDAVERARTYVRSSGLDPGPATAATGRLSDLAAVGGSVTTELSALGDPVQITAPPGSDSVDYLADPERLAQRLASCEAQAP